MTPKIGDIVYIDTSLYLSHGEDDVRGGKVKVKNVKTDEDTIWLEFEGFENESHSWNHLKDQQEELKNRFGDEWARKTPDLRPEFNTFD